MGKLKQELPNSVKQKKKIKRNKTEIVFDDMKRTDFLNGFSKRKQQRKKKAQEEIIAKLKEEKRQIKLQKREELDRKWKELNMTTDVENLGKAETMEMSAHTVTVTDVSAVDFVGSSGFMLGTNKGLYQDSDEEGEQESINPQDIKKKLKKISAPKKFSHQKHKNFSHSMSNKNLSKKRHAAQRSGGKPKKKPRRNAKN